MASKPIKGEKSKKNSRTGGNDSQEDRSPTRSEHTSGGESEERENSENRSATMDPAIAAQIRLMAQETVAAMMTAWRQGRNPDLTSDDDENVEVRGE